MGEFDTVSVTSFFLGRGLRGEPLGEGTVEMSVDLPDLGPDLDETMLKFQARPWHVWLPLTTVVDGVPELVWEDDNALIPTCVPVPAGTGIDGFGFGEGTPEGGT